MITARHNPRSREALFKVVTSALAGARVAVAQAGHFLLYEDEAICRAVPCIKSELSDPKHLNFSQEFGHFPYLSWRLASDLMEALALEEGYLLVLVNDWQYVPTKAAKDAFYSEYQLLPKVYREDVGQTTRLLTPRGPAGFDERSPFFSERVLRNQFHRRLKKLTGSAELPEGLRVSRTEASATCRLEVMGQLQEIYCSTKSADCSGEVAQLLDDSCRLVGCDAFINFVPNVCQSFVELGSELPAKLFETPIRRIINISLPATKIACEQDMLGEASVTVHSL